MSVGGEMMGMGTNKYRGSGTSVLFKPLSHSSKSSNKPWENWASRSDTPMRQGASPEASQSFLLLSCQGQPYHPSSPGEVAWLFEGVLSPG